MAKQNSDVDAAAVASAPSLAEPAWLKVKDGNPIARAMFGRHYSYNSRREQMSFFASRNRNYSLIVGPGEKMVLLTPEGSALFAWRKFMTADHQQGVNCCVFRNEGGRLASDLIREADRLAWEKWPGERHYTYVDPRKVRSRNPGYCFIMAGWRRCGITKARRYLIFEILPAEGAAATSAASTTKNSSEDLSR